MTHSCATFLLYQLKYCSAKRRFRPSHSVYNSWQHLRCDEGLLGWQQLWSDQVEQETMLIFEHIHYSKPEYLLRRRMEEDVNAATKSAVRTSIRCSTVTMGISCVVFDIWPRDGQWQRTDGKRTDRCWQA